MNLTLTDHASWPPPPAGPDRHRPRRRRWRPVAAVALGAGVALGAACSDAARHLDAAHFTDEYCSIQVDLAAGLPDLDGAALEAAGPQEGPAIMHRLATDGAAVVARARARLAALGEVPLAGAAQLVEVADDQLEATERLMTTIIDVSADGEISAGDQVELTGARTLGSPPAAVADQPIDPAIEAAFAASGVCAEMLES